MSTNKEKLYAPVWQEQEDGSFVFKLIEIKAVNIGPPPKKEENEEQP